ncbi:DUF397 domain-containing protein [Streptomyces sp. NPDC018972]|uniref:DUF397 domain-containing protein n=1 Tax=Streptomyces sp. NPDC018972 TaxID=3365060 RepID=UPI0037B9D99C
MTDRTIPHSGALQGWRKSSHSNDQGGSCVEVADDDGVAGVAVRDSKVEDGPAVVFSVAGWTSFITALKN